MNKNYYTKFINFFIKHQLYDEETFKYIERNTTRFGYYDEELMNIRGIYYSFNEIGQLTKFKLYLPYIDSEITAFMNIRPYIQAIQAYKKIGKKYKENANIEMIALSLEKIYLKENPNQEIKEYFNKIYTSIKEQETEKKYKVALKAEPELSEYFQKNISNFTKLNRKARILARRYQKCK